MGYLGPGRPDITATAQRVVEAAGETWTAPRRWGGAPARAEQGFVRGLYTGGTLCDEAMLIAAEAFGTVASNIPLADQPALGADLASQGHTFIDFGDDQLTAGRPHPMIEPGLRNERLARELADDTCAVVLLDVVLGLGSHADPATELAAVIADATKPVIISIVGTRDDPQGLDAQAERLAAAGAVVHASNAAAAREAVALVAGGGLMSTETVVTAGVELLDEALRVQGVTTEAVDWAPPVAGTEDALTTVMLDRRRAEANAEAVRRMTTARAALVDVRPASEALQLRAR